MGGTPTCAIATLYSAQNIKMPCAFGRHLIASAAREQLTMSSFYGQAANRQSRSRSSTSVRLGVQSGNRLSGSIRTTQVSTGTRRPAITYSPGMYLRDHPEAPLLVHTSDDDLDAGGTDDLYSGELTLSPVDSSSHPATSSPVITPRPDARQTPFVTPHAHHTPPGLPLRVVNRPELSALLQQQQATLEAILSNQKSMQEKQSEMESKLFDLEKKISSPPSAASASSDNSSGKRKQVVTRDLSVSTSCII